jgi:hypothetical protein
MALLAPDTPNLTHRRPDPAEWRKLTCGSAGLPPYDMPRPTMVNVSFE